jgi:CRISPR-associated RAMP protein (TIGR02581 family)
MVTGGRGACNPVMEAEWCLTREVMERLRREARQRGDVWFTEQVWGRSCRVCRVFGSPWLASRVRFADLACVDEGRVELRDGVSIHREKETVENKYDFETVPAGTCFRLFLLAENLDPAERGLLWLGLRELERGHIAVGGFKGRGLGQVTLADPTLRLVDAQDRPALKRYLLDSHMREVSPGEADQWIEALWNTLEGGDHARTVL